MAYIDFFKVILRKGLSQKSDVWSVGCVVIEMLTGRPPWSDKTKNVKHVYNLITSKGSLISVQAG